MLRFLLMACIALGLLVQPADTNNEVVASSMEVTQIQFGNGIVRQVSLGEPTTQCATGTTLDLTQAGVDLLANGYYFAAKGHTLAPSIREIDGTEQVYLVSLGQKSEYLVFWAPQNGGIAATRMSGLVPEPFSLEGPTSYQNWQIASSDSRVTMKNGDTKIWITRTGNSFCVEMRTQSSSFDLGIFKLFADNGVLPSGEEIETAVLD